MYTSNVFIKEIMEALNPSNNSILLNNPLNGSLNQSYNSILLNNTLNGSLNQSYSTIPPTTQKSNDTDTKLNTYNEQPLKFNLSTSSPSPSRFNEHKTNYSYNSSSYLNNNNVQHNIPVSITQRHIPVPQPYSHSRRHSTASSVNDIFHTLHTNDTIEDKLLQQRLHQQKQLHHNNNNNVSANVAPPNSGATVGAIRALQSDNELLNHKIAQLTQQLTELNIQYESHINTNTKQYEQQINDATNKYKTNETLYIQQLHSLEQRESTLSSQLNELTNRYNDIQQQLYDTTSNYTQLQTQHEYTVDKSTRLNDNLKSVEQLNVQLQHQLNQMQSDYNNTATQLKQLELQHNTNTTQYSETQTKLDDVIKLLDTVKQQYHESQITVEQQKYQLNDCNTMIQQLNNTNNQQQIHIGNEQQKYNKLQSFVDSARDTINEILHHTNQLHTTSLSHRARSDLTDELYNTVKQLSHHVNSMPVGTTITNDNTNDILYNNKQSAPISTPVLSDYTNRSQPIQTLQNISQSRTNGTTRPLSASSTTHRTQPVTSRHPAPFTHGLSNNSTSYNINTNIQQLRSKTPLYMNEKQHIAPENEIFNLQSLHSSHVESHLNDVQQSIHELTDELNNTYGGTQHQQLQEQIDELRLHYQNVCNQNQSYQSQSSTATNHNHKNTSHTATADHRSNPTQAATLSSLTSPKAKRLLNKKIKAMRVLNEWKQIFHT